MVNGNEAYNLWLNVPVPLYLSVYIYNITNPDWFEKGNEKLIVKEVGPYVFKETRTKKIISQSDDEISFIPKSYFEFLEEKSNGLKLTDKFTTINMPLLVSKFTV